MSPTDEVFSGSSDLTSGEITSNSTYDGDCQRESDVGITEYISSHEGFSAIIKQRYIFNSAYYYVWAMPKNFEFVMVLASFYSSVSKFWRAFSPIDFKPWYNDP